MTRVILIPWNFVVNPDIHTTHQFLEQRVILYCMEILTMYQIKQVLHVPSENF